jgi:hypothetical protein
MNVHKSAVAFSLPRTVYRSSSSAFGSITIPIPIVAGKCHSMIANTIINIIIFNVKNLCQNNDLYFFAKNT